MTFTLDTRTLALTMACVTTAITAIMLYIQLTQKTYPGFKAWTGMFALSTAASALIGLRGAIPDFLSVVVANMCAVGGYAVLVSGLRQFYNQRPVRLNLVLLFLTAVGLIYLTYVAVDIRLRAVIVALALSIMAFRCALDLLRMVAQGKSHGAGLITFTMIGFTINQTIRAVTSALSNAKGDFFDPSVVSSTATNLYLLMSLVLLITLVCSLVLLVTARLNQELRLAQAELLELARTDMLTGVSNLRDFLTRGATAVRMATAQGAPLGLIVLDIDYFKTINDTYGHQTGDVVLKQLATACKGVLRKTDLLARVGGDEFIVLLPDTPDTLCAQVTDRIAAAVAQLDLKEIGITTRLSISGGWAALSADDSDINALIHRADIEMYKLKARRHQMDKAESSSSAEQS